MAKYYAKGRSSKGSPTNFGRLLRQARGILSLRQAEEFTETLGGHRIGRETWRLYESGRVARVRAFPERKMVEAAATLPGAPSYMQFLGAIVADADDRFLARYGCRSADVDAADDQP